VPRELSDLIVRLIAFAPETRIPSATDLLGELQRLAMETPVLARPGPSGREREAARPGGQAVLLGYVRPSTSCPILDCREMLRRLEVCPSPSHTDRGGAARIAEFSSAGAAVAYALGLQERLTTHDWRAEGIRRPVEACFVVHAGEETDLRESPWPRGDPEGTGSEAARAVLPRPGDVIVTEAAVWLALQDPPRASYFEPLSSTCASTTPACSRATGATSPTSAPPRTARRC
jgi:hypothetical protein